MKKNILLLLSLILQTTIYSAESKPTGHEPNQDTCTIEIVNQELYDTMHSLMNDPTKGLSGGKATILASLLSNEALSEIGLPKATPANLEIRGILCKTHESARFLINPTWLLQQKKLAKG